MFAMPVSGRSSITHIHLLVHQPPNILVIQVIIVLRRNVKYLGSHAEQSLPVFKFCKENRRVFAGLCRRPNGRIWKLIFYRFVIELLIMGLLTSVCSPGSTYIAYWDLRTFEGAIAWSWQISHLWSNCILSEVHWFSGVLKSRFTIAFISDDSVLSGRVLIKWSWQLRDWPDAQIQRRDIHY